MKKIISSVLLTAILVFACTCTAFAFGVSVDIDINTTCRVSSDMASIEYMGKTFVPADANISYVDSDSEYLNVSFENESAAERFVSFDVAAYDECDYILCAEIEKTLYDIQTVFYVEQSRLAEVEAVGDRTGAARYVAEYSYTGNSCFISAENMLMWKNGVQGTQIKGSQLELYDTYGLYTTGGDGLLRCEAGMIFLIPPLGEDSSGTYYLLDYSDYDRSYFYSDGGFALDGDTTATVYELDNAEIAEKLDALYISEDTVDDELSWPLGGEVSDASLAVTCVFLFGIVPLTIAVVCLVFILKGTQSPYRTCLKLMLSGCLLVIVCFLVVFFMLI